LCQFQKGLKLFFLIFGDPELKNSKKLRSLKSFLFGYFSNPISEMAFLRQLIYQA